MASGNPASLMVLLAGVCSSRAEAQVFESVGTRAQGLGGAFVAVADDATANWWNAAGLATGAYFNVVLERGRTTEPEDPDPGSAASRVTTTGFSAAFPALGLSYYRLRISAIAPPATIVPPADGREDPGDVGRAERSVRYSQFSSTVGQSIGDHFVLGSTLKLLRAGAESRTLTADSSLDTVDDVPVAVDTKFGLDLGAMLSFPRIRVGLSVRNLHEANLGSDEQPLRLKRQARAGVALLGGKAGPLDAVTLSADADLTRSETIFGDVRHLATGAEAWLFARHIGLRGGFSANSIGEWRPTMSVGASIAPVTGFFVDGAWSTGRDGSLEGWTTSLRFTF